MITLGFGLQKGKQMKRNPIERCRVLGNKVHDMLFYRKELEALKFRLIIDSEL
jgi:hypothetical protein